MSFLDYINGMVNKVETDMVHIFLNPVDECVQMSKTKPRVNCDDFDQSIAWMTIPPLSSHKIKEMIGEGTFGVVSKCFDSMGKKCAIKIVHKKLVNELNLTDNIKNEMNLVKHMNHPHIVNVWYTYETTHAYIQIMEYYPGTLDTDQIICEIRLRKYAYQILSALSYLHTQKRLFHGDIALGNICVDIKDNVQIIDFNLTRPIGYYNDCAGHGRYFPPEMIQKKEYYGPKVDIWGLGVCLFKLCTGHFPFRYTCDIVNQRFFVCLDDEDNLSDLCKSFIMQCLEYDSLKRPNANQLIKHHWIGDISR
jgi:serine/threonine protein kinase